MQRIGAGSWQILQYISEIMPAGKVRNRSRLRDLAIECIAQAPKIRIK